MAQAALYLEEAPTVPIEQMDSWILRPVWILVKSLLLPQIKPRFLRSAASVIVIIPTALCSLLKHKFNVMKEVRGKKKLNKKYVKIPAVSVEQNGGSRKLYKIKMS